MDGTFARFVIRYPLVAVVLGVARGRIPVDPLVDPVMGRTISVESAGSASPA